MQLAAFTLSAFFKEIQSWPEHPLHYPDLSRQIPVYVVLAVASLALLYRRGRRLGRLFSRGRCLVWLVCEYFYMKRDNRKANNADANMFV